MSKLTQDLKEISARLRHNNDHISANRIDQAIEAINTYDAGLDKIIKKIKEPNE